MIYGNKFPGMKRHVPIDIRDINAPLKAQYYLLLFSAT